MIILIYIGLSSLFSATIWIGNKKISRSSYEPTVRLSRPPRQSAVRETGASDRTAAPVGPVCGDGALLPGRRKSLPPAKRRRDRQKPWKNKRIKNEIVMNQTYSLIHQE